MLAGLTATLLLLGLFLGTPVIRTLAACGLVDADIGAVPIRPFDGGYLRSRVANLLITIALIAVAAYWCSISI